MTAHTHDSLRADDLRQLISDAVDAAFRAYTADAQGQRDDLYALTMSGLGGCSRQAAYRLARTPPSEEMVFTEMKAANLGTMIHLGLLPHVAELTGGAAEIAVTLKIDNLVIEGRSDLYLEPWATVSDLKTVGSYKFAALSDTVNRSHLLQVAGYAQAVADSGREVKWISWIYLDRATGQHRVIVEPFGPNITELIEQRCAELAVYANDPEAAPREERGPGLSVICDSCPWLRACWGDDAERGIIGAQKTLIHDHEGVAKALSLYDDARVRAREAKSDLEFARAMFSGFEPGAYGEWEFRFSGGSDTADKDAAVALLAEAGIEIPQKTSARRLIVKRTQVED